MKKLITALVTLTTFAMAEAQQIDKQTFLYSVKGADSLYLDKYDVFSNGNTKPCVMFMFGGGFVNGARDEARYLSYFTYLVEQGYCVVSIDYRLGFKGYAPAQSATPADWLSRFVYTIGIAVEDLYDATSFVVENAAQWNVDPKMIVASGSSAGAVSVLQGEYYISNGHELTAKLPKDFNYAGIISFAGAVFTIGEIQWPVKPCPIQMFHGDADGNVPYDRIFEMGVGFFGSKHIASTLDQFGAPYYFYSAGDAGHEMAVDPMADNLAEIGIFLDRMVKGRQAVQVNTSVSSLGKPAKGKEFSIIDYIKANFGG